MKRFKVKNINTEEYWNSHQTAFDFGLRQQKYMDLAGTGETLCDIGCGLSPFLDKVRENFKWVCGLDFSEETIKKARDLYPNVAYFKIDINDFQYKPKLFDVVVAGEVIEHLEDPNKFLRVLEDLAKKKVIVSTPNLEFDDPEHLWEFDEQFFKDKGYTTEVIESERFIGRKYIFAYKTL